MSIYRTVRRMCSTCRHGNTDMQEPPCCFCDRQLDKWEPKEVGQ